MVQGSLQAKRPLGDGRRRLPEQESRAPSMELRKRRAHG